MINQVLSVLNVLSVLASSCLIGLVVVCLDRRAPPAEQTPDLRYYLRYYTEDEQVWILSWAAGDHAGAMRAAGRWAADDDLSFTWYDCWRVVKQIHDTVSAD